MGCLFCGPVPLLRLIGDCRSDYSFLRSHDHITLGPATVTLTDGALILSYYISLLIPSLHEGGIKPSGSCKRQKVEPQVNSSQLK